MCWDGGRLLAGTRDSEVFQVSLQSRDSPACVMQVGVEGRGGDRKGEKEGEKEGREGREGRRGEGRGGRGGEERGGRGGKERSGGKGRKEGVAFLASGLFFPRTFLETACMFC